MALVVAGIVLDSIGTLFHEHKASYFSDVVITDEIYKEACHNDNGVSLSNIHLKHSKDGFGPMIVATLTNHNPMPIVRYGLSYKTFLGNGQDFAKFIVPTFVAPGESRPVVYILTQDNFKAMKDNRLPVNVCIDPRSIERIYDISELKELKETDRYVYEEYQNWLNSLPDDKKAKVMDYLTASPDVAQESENQAE